MNDSWNKDIDPRDWAAMTRTHEAAHVVASEALGIPVVDVWADVDPTVETGGRYRNGSGDSQLQCVVYNIGSYAGAEELWQRGYPEELAHFSKVVTGRGDRTTVAQVIAEAAENGYRLDVERAQRDALAILDSPGFFDTVHNVAQALQDQGDRLTGADVRAAIGTWQLDRDLWVPSTSQLPQPAADLAADDDLEIEL